MQGKPRALSCGPLDTYMSINDDLSDPADLSLGHRRRAVPSDRRARLTKTGNFKTARRVVTEHRTALGYLPTLEDRGDCLYCLRTILPERIKIATPLPPLACRGGEARGNLNVYYPQGRFVLVVRGREESLSERASPPPWQPQQRKPNTELSLDRKHGPLLRPPKPRADDMIEESFADRQPSDT